MSSCVVCVWGITGEEMLRRGFHLAAGALTPPRVASFCVMPEFHIVPLVGTDSYFFEWVCAGGTFRPSPMRAWGRTQLALWLTSGVRPSLRIDTTHPISTLLFLSSRGPETSRLPHPSQRVRSSRSVLSQISGVVALASGTKSLYGLSQFIFSHLLVSHTHFIDTTRSLTNARLRERLVFNMPKKFGDLAYVHLPQPRALSFSPSARIYDEIFSACPTSRAPPCAHRSALRLNAG